MEKYSKEEIITMIRALQSPYKGWEDDYPDVANALLLEIRKLEKQIPELMKVGIGMNSTQRALKKQEILKEKYPELYFFATHSKSRDIFKPKKKVKK